MGAPSGVPPLWLCTPGRAQGSVLPWVLSLGTEWHVFQFRNAFLWFCWGPQGLFRCRVSRLCCHTLIHRHGWSHWVGIFLNIDQYIYNTVFNINISLTCQINKIIECLINLVNVDDRLPRSFASLSLTAENRAFHDSIHRYRKLD